MSHTYYVVNKKPDEIWSHIKEIIRSPKNKMLNDEKGKRWSLVTLITSTLHGKDDSLYCIQEEKNELGKK